MLMRIISNKYDTELRPYPRPQPGSNFITSSTQGRSTDQDGLKLLYDKSYQAHFDPKDKVGLHHRL